MFSLILCDIYTNHVICILAITRFAGGCWQIAENGVKFTRDTPGLLKQI